MPSPAVSDAIEVREDTWPLLILYYPSVVNDRTTDSIVETFERAYARATSFVAIHDGTNVSKFPGARERARITDWMGDPERLQKERLYLLGTALVLPSGTMRALVSAIYLVRRPATPQRWMGTFEEAVDWCRERLAEAGVASTPAIDSLPGRFTPSAVRSRAPSRGPRH
jgi:hypothetical protein